MLDEIINIDELYQKYPLILNKLLMDNTTHKNIIFATNSYRKYGYKFNDCITFFEIVNNRIIIPRSKKDKKEQLKRSKDSAEVFTPSWICNQQNNLIDEAWFGEKNVFNIETEKSWYVNSSKIEFTNNKTWIDYIKDIRLEISCGEAPYIVSIYDSVTGEKIELSKRIGILDRKLRVVSENTNLKEEWLTYALEALKSTYGYEWQGDSLFIARENILKSFIGYYYNMFNELLNIDLIIKISEIISWNIWQMDGVKCVIPNSCKKKRVISENLFGEKEIINLGCKGCEKKEIFHHNGIYAKIMDWEKNKKIRFVDLIRGGYNI